MKSSLKYLGITLVIAVICNMLFSQYPNSETKSRFLSKNELLNTIEADFAKYLSKFNKHYGERGEYLKRLKVFEENKKIVEEHNSNPEKSFVLALNNFADWTKEEFEKLLTYRPEIQDGPSNDGTEGRNLGTLATSIDWVTSGAVSSV